MPGGHESACGIDAADRGDLTVSSTHTQVSLIAANAHAPRLRPCDNAEQC